MTSVILHHPIEAASTPTSLPLVAVVHLALLLPQEVIVMSLRVAVSLLDPLLSLTGDLARHHLVAIGPCQDHLSVTEIG